MKVRKKPVEVDAWLWNQHGDHAAVTRPEKNTTNYCPICGIILYDHGIISTLEGDMKVCPGDYVIRGVQNEYYACKPEIFWETYEEVGDDGREST